MSIIYVGEAVKKRAAFTLVELLVVIAIISLLLAIMMPALQKAREQGRRTVCLNHLKSLELSNEVYANSCNGWYVPLVDTSGVTGPSSVNQQSVNPYIWLTNLEYRKITGVKDAEKFGTNYSSEIVLPDKFFCPSDQVAKQHIKSDKNVLVSYGYNSEDWWGNKATPQNSFPSSIPRGTSYGYRQSQIRKPSQKLIFADSIDWWLLWNGANYVAGWDRLGQKQRLDYANAGIVGPVVYRHDQGANVAFYDGHVEYLKKQKVFVNGNPTAPIRSGWDATGMWTNK